MYTHIHSAALNGLTALPVRVEINANKPSSSSEQQYVFFMVGLPDNAVRESKQRVSSALQNCGFPTEPLIVTVNLAPADVRKEGSGFDLPLAVGMLQLTRQIKVENLDDSMFVGELGLDGSVRSIRGALSIAVEAKRQGMQSLYVPLDNAREAAVVEGISVYGVENLSSLLNHLNGIAPLQPIDYDVSAEFERLQGDHRVDFSDVKGQEAAKRAFEVAAAGGHNLMVIGSPGCGKSMMAKRMSTILPPLTLDEALETTRLYSIAGKLGKDNALVSVRPFRSPHHTISDVALIGGGSNLQPGEISLAHNGVLFLDEMPEFSRNGLETLRQPLEDREITISRAKYTATLPCAFMLVAAMNPCPCGYYNDPTHKCSCSQGQILRYMSKISGPLLDRIDLQIEMTPVPLEVLQNMPKGETSAAIRERVVSARARQTERFSHLPHVHCNAQMSAREIEQYAQPDESGRQALAIAMKRLQLSARAYERVLKMSRTIADLAGREAINFYDVSEAVGYRNLDKKNWGESY